MQGLGLFSDHAEYHTRILPILFYTVVLRPYPQDFTSTEWFPEYEHCSDFATVCKEQHDDFSKSWTCGFSPTDRFIAPPLIGEELDRLFMFREFRPFFINRHHIVAFSVHKDRFKSHFSQGVNQVAATIPRIKGDRIVSDIYSGPFKERQDFLEHSDDTGGFIRIPASLFADQSHIQGNDPFSNL